MDFILTQDIQPLISVPEIPSNKFLELQYKLHSYGFVYWLNAKQCTLTDIEKAALTVFRDTNFNFKKYEKDVAPSKVSAFIELNDIAKKMCLAYPRYQNWLKRRILNKNSKLYRHPQFMRYHILNLPMAEIKIEKKIKDVLLASGYRSIYEMLLTNNYFEWRKIIVPDRDFKRFYRFMQTHNFADLIQLDKSLK